VQEAAAPLPPSSDLDPLELAPQFASESEELLAKAETGLLAAEEDPARASEPFAEAFRAIHSFKGNCGFMGYAPLEQVSHRAETLLDILRNAQQPFPGLSPAVAALLKALDLLRTGLAETARTGHCPAELLAPGVPALEQAIAEAHNVGSAPALPSGPAASAAAQPAPSRAEASSSASAVEDAAHAQAAGAQRQDIRVDVQKLDRLVNLVGELVIAEAMVTGHPAIAGLDEESLSRAIHLLRRVSLDLQDVAMSVRMVPLSGAFRKLVRLTHDLSQKLGKKVRLDLLGEETEVDKSVLEHLADPLIHLVRNAVDHGLERPEDRARAGKSEEGRVTVEARHEGGEVLVFVEDDGRGLDRDRIVAKAIERGLLQGSGDKLTDEQVYALVFEPGFSTANEVSDISGRGVGMDVVRKNIQKLGGSLELRSRTGAGTTVVIHIPLTLAIIDGMLVRVGHARFTLPLLAIREALRPAPEQITVTPDGQEVARVRDRLIPVVRLHEVFRRKPDHASLHHGILVIVEVNGHTAGLFADEILGQQQAVIKGLSGYLGKARGVSGCTILGDGEVSLILDVGALLGLAQSGATA
jgi:two-component system chemotaxis sensor kinase CheA